MDIKVNLEHINANIKQYAKKDNVKLVAVTKTVGLAEMEALLALGITDFAESKAQMLEEKTAALKNYPNITWHFIGHLQTNKIKKVLPVADYIHSVDSVRLAEAIDAAAGKSDRRPKILLEVNISGETAKYGFSADALMASLPDLAKLDNIDIVGLMTMAPLDASQDQVREIFKQLILLGEKANFKKFDKIRITEYSMGMSDDYQIALEEGATIIRIGSAIFK